MVADPDARSINVVLDGEPVQFAESDEEGSFEELVARYWFHGHSVGMEYNESHSRVVPGAYWLLAYRPRSVELPPAVRQ